MTQQYLASLVMRESITLCLKQKTRGAIEYFYFIGGELFMPFATIPEAIAAIRAGEMIILCDDEDRENEGDLCIAAEKVTPQVIAFMARMACGLICLAMQPERLDQLALPLMVTDNTSQRCTAFTVSIDAAAGITTGISAADRALTIRLAIDPGCRPEDIARPGHVFPLRACPGGVLERCGQTEGSVDLARLAGLEPAAVICEIMNPDGTMARRPELEVFARKYGLKMATVADLVAYRETSDRPLESCGRA
jgi:3,4-dihydroxy 2-butanone 4-phosphate synthase / GTP cyclohydrolase II